MRTFCQGAAGAAGHGIDGGEVGGVVEGDVPGGVGGHGVAEHVDAGGIDVEAAGDVIHRLDDGVDAGVAGAPELVEIQNRHEDDGVGVFFAIHRGSTRCKFWSPHPGRGGGLVVKACSSGSFE